MAAEDYHSFHSWVDDFNPSKGRAVSGPVDLLGALPPPAAPPSPQRAFVPSPQQQAIFDWIGRNTHASAFVEAVAGAGKTTTLIEGCARMRGSIAFAAYNRKIANEIKARLEQRGIRAFAGTFHSFGFNAWRRVHPGVTVDERAKSDRMTVECGVTDLARAAVRKLVSLGKQSGFGTLWATGDHIGFAHPDVMWQRIVYHHDILNDVDVDLVDPDEEALLVQTLSRKAEECLAWSLDNGNKIIDFDDMIWLPLVAGARVFENDWVLVDEAQDTNPARRLLARRMLRRSGRSLWVGDRHQAIYGFTGADADAVDIIMRDFGCTSLPLTTTYRCPKRVVELAQRWVSHIQAHETAPDGVVREVDAEALMKELVARDPGELAQDAILCRNTRPLVSLAFQLIRRGIGCHVEGRDIGQGLIRLARRWKVKSAAALRKNLDAYREREIARARKRGQNGYGEEAINDRVDSLLVVMEGCSTVEEVVAKLERMFRDTENGGDGTLTLSTVHKAKGREWDRVYILGFARYMPSRFAHQPWQMQQETNLMYVAATRAKRELVLTAALEA